VERFYKEFGRLLREARERPNTKLTQQQLATKVGLSRTSITNIESGKQHISLQMLFILANAVGAKPGQLLPDQSFASSDAGSLLSKIDQMQFSKATKELLQKSVSADKPTIKSET
jgi:transcriptional regulator with XRE-family HTH domain